MKKIFEKIKSFFINNKKLLWNLLLVILGVIAISVISLLLLMVFNVVYFDDGMKFNAELFLSFKDAWYGWVLFILLQTVLSMLLCAIPGAAMAFTLLSMTIYTEPWQAFIISFVAMLIASFSLYTVGRIGGYKICVKLMGEKDCERSLTLLRNKGTVYFPLLMAFPTFPDEALTMIAGTLKMSLKWFVPSIFIARGIGIAAITFGLSSIPFDKFTTPFHWIIFILLCAALIVGVFYAAHKLNVLMEKRRKKEDATTETESETNE